MFKKIYKKGQALVEFALIAPLFFLLMFGMIDWGLYFYSAIIVENAVRDACRAGITWNDWSTNEANRIIEIENMIADRCDNLLPGNANPTTIEARVNISYTPSLGSMEYLTVEVLNQPYDGFSPAGAMIPDTIQARSTFRYER